MDLTPELPARVLLPAAAPPRIESPDPAKAPLPRLAANPGELDRATPETDPTPRGANPVLATVPPPRKKPAPPLLLTIPTPAGDPSGSILAAPRSDDDPPVPSPGAPETPKLSRGK
jgi:serine/threonine-protein kinase